MSVPLVEAWHLSLSELSNERGIEAFKHVSKSTQFGDVEPAHILEAARLLHASALTSDPHHPPISRAPIFDGVKFNSDLTPSDEFEAWATLERDKLYKAVDSDGNLFLIQNPSAWDWVITRGKVVYIRPTPEYTGETLKQQKPRAA